MSVCEGCSPGGKCSVLCGTCCYCKGDLPELEWRTVLAKKCKECIGEGTTLQYIGHGEDRDLPCEVCRGVGLVFKWEGE